MGARAHDEVDAAGAQVLMRRLLLPLVVLLALVASACGGSEPTAEQVSPDAVVLAASKTNEAGTYKADVSGTMDVAGQSIDMSGTGAFDAREAAGSNVVRDEPERGLGRGHGHGLRLPVIYMELPPESGAAPGRQEVDQDGPREARAEAGFDFDQMMRAGQTDPSGSRLSSRGEGDSRGRRRRRCAASRPRITRASSTCAASAPSNPR